MQDQPTASAPAYPQNVLCQQHTDTQAVTVSGWKIAAECTGIRRHRTHSDTTAELSTICYMQTKQTHVLCVVCLHVIAANTEQARRAPVAGGSGN
jgi:hypothetical protein